MASVDAKGFPNPEEKLNPGSESNPHREGKRSQGPSSWLAQPGQEIRVTGLWAPASLMGSHAAVVNALHGDQRTRESCLGFSKKKCMIGNSGAQCLPETVV